MAELAEKVIKPGGQAEIKVTFNAGQRRGNQKKRVTVESNDPNTPRLFLYIEGMVNEMLAFDPRAIRLIDMEAGKKATSEVKITNKSQKPIKITELKVSDSAIVSAAFQGEGEVSLPLELGVGETVTLLVTGQLPEDKKRYRATVSLVTDERPNQPSVIAVVMQLKGATFKPKKLKAKKMDKKKKKKPKKVKKIKKKKKKKPQDQ